MLRRFAGRVSGLDDIPVTEVAERFGVTRQRVHRWVARYRESGLAGLADRSHAPKAHPWQLSAEVEAVICDLRTAHRSWGPRRLVFELERRSPHRQRQAVHRPVREASPGRGDVRGICRENGITQRLTKPRSPTTTGKIERLRQTLQLELLNVRGPFASIEDAQAAVDA